MTLAEAFQPTFRAVLSTATSLLAFALLRIGGAGTETGLISGLVLAGFLSIRSLWLLNRDGLLPTSEQALGS